MPKLSTTTSEEVDADEHAIDAAGEKRDPFITRVSVTIAILAVVGVTLGSLESLETSASSSANSAALLHQDRATDYWSSYEAQNIKSMLQTLAPVREMRASAGAPARHGNTAPEDLATAARAQEDLSEAKLRDAEKHERRHHVLTMAVTLVQVAIAIATIAIIAKSQRWPWYASIALGIAGVAIGALAYA